MSCRELLDELFTESATADEFESKMREAGIPFVSSDDPPDVVQAFKDKYPFADGTRAHLGGIAGDNGKTWFVATV
jgi:hypothetical protein